jgi:para-nitrobenzyl esterase
LLGRDLIRLVVVVAIFGQLGTSALTVQTPSGKVIGYKSNNAQRFLGIQFAKAGRWQAPTLVTGNPSTIINATDYGPSCMQKPGYVPPNLSEDCLFINVYAPIWTTPTANLSVFVWIHGGGFLYGGSVSYPADDLVDLGNMIVVTFNYRLGPFGFMASATMAQENPQLNYGLQDQQLALLWVQKNIRYFGGNPDNVLIIGQSAGGASVLVRVCILIAINNADVSIISQLHLLTKGSMGLFHKAYSMSPGALYDVKSTKQSFADAQKVEEAIGCASVRLPITKLWSYLLARPDL